MNLIIHGAISFILFFILLLLFFLLYEYLPFVFIFANISQKIFCWIQSFLEFFATETLSSGFSSFLDKRVKLAVEDQEDSRKLGTGKLPGLLIMFTLPTIALLD